MVTANTVSAKNSGLPNFKAMLASSGAPTTRQIDPTKSPTTAPISEQPSAWPASPRFAIA